jgi:UDP-N-acetylmuramoyl-tripeptide--D-alanyl-D-alanine ligase
VIIAVLLALLWSALACWRIYRLARFFQIEEYMSGRFLRWMAARWERFAPKRFLGGALAGFIATGAALLLDVDLPAVHAAWWVGVAAIIGWPEPVKEVKKRFKATQRATRLLATAFTLAGVWNVGFMLVLLARVDQVEATTLQIIALVGLLAYFIAPLALPVANGLMYPLESTLRRMFRERARRRLQESKVKVIGVTGSFGKTSTKDYLAHILGGRYKVIKTPKSYNTLVGVSLTINNDFDPQAGYEYYVIEMGAYMPGEIKRICDLTRPQIGIIVAIGPQHLERFGAPEKIVTAKYELVQAIPKEGFVAFNWDDPRVRGMAERGHPDTRIGVSCADPPAEDARLIAGNIRHSLEGLAFDVADRSTGEERTFTTSLIGLHNVTNILLATAVARQLGMSLNEIALRVTTLMATEHRLKQTRLPNGITMLDDAYNTNPVGSANALQVLALNKNGRRVLITPGMIELGDLQEAENEKLGRLAAEVCTDIVLVGVEQTRPIQRGVKSVTTFDPSRLHVFDTVTEAIQWYQRELRQGDAVLILNDLPDNYF